MSASLFKIQKHTFVSQHVREYPGAMLESQEAVLQLELKQYTPLSNLNPNPGDVTIIAAHACGFPKEVYEPLWDALLRRSQTDDYTIRSIWIADVTNQSASYKLNEPILGNDPSWFDHSRDLLHMINTFRDEMPRPLIGIGHSMGGCQLAYLSLLHPRLLTTLILIDPVIQLFASIGPSADPGRASTFRRDIWPSLSAATTSLQRSPFYSRWDPRVLQLFLHYGLSPVPTILYPLPAPSSTTKSPAYTSQAVTLTTPKHQEVFTFSRPHYTSAINPISHPDIDPTDTNTPSYRPEPVQVFTNLPFLRPSVLYIFGENSVLSTPDLQEAKMSRTGTGIGGSGGRDASRVKSRVLQGVGHLVPMEAVGRTADAIGEWTGSEMRGWRGREHEWRHDWEGRSVDERRTIRPEWEQAVRDSIDTDVTTQRGSKL